MAPSPFAPTIYSSLATAGNIAINSSGLEPDEIRSEVRTQASGYGIAVLETSGRDFELLDFSELMHNRLLLVDDYDPEDLVQDRTMRSLLREDGSYAVPNSLRNVVTITYGPQGKGPLDNRFQRFHHFSRALDAQAKMRAFLNELYENTL